MKTFCSETLVQNASQREILEFLIQLISPKYIRDAERIIADIETHDSFKDGKCAVIGDVYVHTARTDGIAEFCLSCARVEREQETVVEMIVLWNDISAHHLGRLSDLITELEKLEKARADCGEIINRLKTF